MTVQGSDGRAGELGTDCTLLVPDCRRVQDSVVLFSTAHRSTEPLGQDQH